MRCQGKGAGPGDIYSPNTKMSLSGTCDSVDPTHVAADFLFCWRKYCKDAHGVSVEHLQSVCDAVLCFPVAVRTETGEEGRTLVQLKVLEKAQAGLPSSVCSTAFMLCERPGPLHSLNRDNGSEKAGGRR